MARQVDPKHFSVFIWAFVMLTLAMLVGSFQNCAGTTSPVVEATSSTSNAGAPYVPLPTSTGTATAGGVCALPNWKSGYTMNVITGFPVANALSDPLTPDGFFVFGLSPQQPPSGMSYSQLSGFSGTPTAAQSVQNYTLQITSNCTSAINTPVTINVLPNQGFQSIRSGPTSMTTCVVSGAGQLCWGFGLANSQATSYSPVSIPGIPASLSSFLFIGRVSLWALLTDSTVWNSDLNQGYVTGGTAYTASFKVTAAAEAVDANNNTYTCYVANGAASCQLQAASVAHSPNNIASGATAVAASVNSGCAIVSGGVKCWGDLLGTGATATSVSGLTAGVTSLAMTGKQQSACAVVNGAVKCWGSELNGAMGTASSTAIVTTPVSISGLGNNMKSVVGGGNHFCANTSGGEVYCWGLNASGQLGDGTVVSSTTAPVQVLNVTSANQLAAGVSHTCALLSSGAVDCWGDNSVGEMSASPTVQTVFSTPVSIVGL